VLGFKTKPILVPENTLREDFLQASILAKTALSCIKTKSPTIGQDECRTLRNKTIIEQMTIGRKCDSNYRSFVRDYENAKDLSRMFVFVAPIFLSLSGKEPPRGLIKLREGAPLFPLAYLAQFFALFHFFA